jgi:nucleotide-binding universal stress UspA family protein
MKILIAVDGSEASKRMVSFLGSHEQWRASANTLRVITVVPAVLPRAASVIDKATLQSHYDDESKAVLEPLRREFDAHGLRPSFEGLIGPPAQTITQAAADGGHELIVMGSRGQGAFANFVLGSVAAKVLATSKVPVMLVP